MLCCTVPCVLCVYNNITTFATYYIDRFWNLILLRSATDWTALYRLAPLDNLGQYLGNPTSNYYNDAGAQLHLCPCYRSVFRFSYSFGSLTPTNNIAPGVQVPIYKPLWPSYVGGTRRLSVHVYLGVVPLSVYIETRRTCRKCDIHSNSYVYAYAAIM